MTRQAGGECPIGPLESFPEVPAMPKRELITPTVSACNRSPGCELLQVVDPADYDGDG